ETMSKHFTLDIIEMKNRARTKVGKNQEKVFSKSTDPLVVALKSNPKRKRGGKETLSPDDKAISFML
ncbi:hypothetical protein Dimus_006095, partial [Dionaea muscipula]